MVIENNEDVVGAVNSLLGSKELIFAEVIPAQCRVDGDNVIISVNSLSLVPFTLHKYRIYEEDAEIKFLREKFLEEAKILQEMVKQKLGKDE